MSDIHRRSSKPACAADGRASAASRGCRSRPFAGIGPGLLAAGALSLLLAIPASAHPLAPSLLELKEQSPGEFDVLWRTPLRRAPGADLSPELPEHCRAEGTPSRRRGETDFEMRWRVVCGEAGLEGARVAVKGLEKSRTAALLRIEWNDRQSLHALLKADQPAVRVGPALGLLAVAQSYTMLGAEHILLGADHLLFVLGLLVLIRGRRNLVMAITAFTAGHSITLALATLDLLQLPSRVAELGIAISLIVVAVEICRGEREGEGESRIRRRPWMMSFGFGLLHGLGFASALREAGLPSDEVPMALLSFNVGIELGQLLFVAVVLVAMALIARRLPSSAWPLRVPGYAIGSLAAFWVIERSAAFF